MASAFGMGSARDRLAPQAMMTAANSRRRSCEADVSSYLRIATDFNAQRLDDRNLGADQFARQPVTRYAGVEHASGVWLHFKNRGAKTHEGQIVSRSEPCGARADDGDTFSSGLGESRHRRETQADG